MNNKAKLICPICGEKLENNGKSLSCSKNHSFDIARQGYINLLPVQNKHSLNPGDTKEMLLARRRFLDSGCYKKICDSVVDKAKELLLGIGESVIADIGCGEGYYTRAICDSIEKSMCIGADISKDGVKMACSRGRDITWLVATASHLPIEDSSVDLVTAMFSLLMEDEFCRILKKGGYIIEVTVGSNHLKELKQIIYDEVFEQHKHPSKCGEKFVELSCENYSFKLDLSDDMPVNLLHMTPHFWRIHKERREMLEQTRSLSVTVSYFIRVLKAI